MRFLRFWNHREKPLQHIIDKKLQELVCPVSLFVPITDGLIGRTRLTQGLKNHDLDQNTVDKLVEILDDMAELKRTSLGEVRLAYIKAHEI